jgi:hypothetical protein
VIYRVINDFALSIANWIHSQFFLPAKISGYEPGDNPADMKQAQKLT